MSKLTFTSLTKLRPYKNNRRVQVKCLHSWQQKKHFLEDNKIHAT
ncbi:unnamed protein product [Brassica rapa]|uniref:Uncharacterized protein n=1 Tax=Brassica campestris TaxID=3711 RepID=A0A3P6A5N4_BRACM|nr:unnamed protein product [Brassica rapa]VDC82824.1 unnamed protein product [Brassica rapa]